MIETNPIRYGMLLMTNTNQTCNNKGQGMYLCLEEKNEALEERHEGGNF